MSVWFQNRFKTSFCHTEWGFEKTDYNIGNFTREKPVKISEIDESHSKVIFLTQTSQRKLDS